MTTSAIGPTSRSAPAFLLFLVLAAAPAEAQSISLEPGQPARWDATGNLGWLSGNKSGIAEEWNDWYDTLAASVDVGRYWTPHFKTEAGAVFTTDGTVYSNVAVPLPSPPFGAFIPREHQFRLNALNLAGAYQFFDNQWVHPFLQAGVQLGWEHERRFAPEHVFPGVDPRNPAIAPLINRDEGYEFEARPFVGGGAKFYVNERGFLRTDISVGWQRGGIAQVSWRAGVGVDF